MFVPLNYREKFRKTIEGFFLFLLTHAESFNNSAFFREIARTSTVDNRVFGDN